MNTNPEINERDVMVRKCAEGVARETILHTLDNYHSVVLPYAHATYKYERARKRDYTYSVYSEAAYLARLREYWLKSSVL